jgi:hypothetical protein
VTGYSEIITRSVEVARQVLSSPAFFKSESTTAGLRCASLGRRTGSPFDHPMLFFREWGHNIITANGEDHVRHKRIIKPAFSGRTCVPLLEGKILPLTVRYATRYQAVWCEGLKTYSEMLSVEGWEGSASFDIRSVNQLMAKVRDRALLLLVRG